MSAHCNNNYRRIAMVYIRDDEVIHETFDSWVEVADFITTHGLEGRNISIVAWEYIDDE